MNWGNYFVSIPYSSKKDTHFEIFYTNNCKLTDKGKQYIADEKDWIYGPSGSDGRSGTFVYVGRLGVVKVLEKNCTNPKESKGNVTIANVKFLAAMKDTTVFYTGKYKPKEWRAKFKKDKKEKEWKIDGEIDGYFDR